MKAIAAAVTKRGQVTIPAEVRRKLGITSRGQVVFEIEDDTVRIRPATSTLEAVFGSVEPITRPEDFNRIIRQAKEDRLRASPTT